MKAGNPQRRAYWLKTLHQWHWISSALCLVGMLVFAFTGITLNHAGQIGAEPQVTTREAELPGRMRLELADAAGDVAAEAPLPPPLRDWLADELDVHAGARAAEWSPDEIYLALPRPGGDAWVAIDLASGAVEYERTDRGAIAFLNDLHKGRDTGPAWGWFIDVFAVACLVFCITGLVLLQLHGGQRAATWPTVGLGLLVPVVLILLFIH
ncbi:PepSY-associated TM helix domain-containing protein [Coralloluteibacterium stylophorae]|uniref:PepSY-associated TM helix domain-containing protein n=1 Tax=Coralloluteibacterium stylophorae TaxID=1776034 RepID=A0A8J7VTL2_9GAMM|nr:PepSY-associated TM helix domain-containing protein [Coralloluteibacterium stylophorae]MBS7457129.1 PepSY-associated TM helix domain-containing protein [Coralloluteibacterium stylophorae]